MVSALKKYCGSTEFSVMRMRSRFTASESKIAHCGPADQSGACEPSLIWSAAAMKLTGLYFVRPMFFQSPWTYGFLSRSLKKAPFVPSKRPRVE